MNPVINFRPNFCAREGEILRLDLEFSQLLQERAEFLL